MDYLLYLDSVPVGVLQLAGAPESLRVRLENQKIVAVGNIDFDSQMGNKKRGQTEACSGARQSWLEGKY
jgi:hypothetical protein